MCLSHYIIIYVLAQEFFISPHTPLSVVSLRLYFRVVHFYRVAHKTEWRMIYIIQKICLCWVVQGLKRKNSDIFSFFCPSAAVKWFIEQDKQSGRKHIINPLRTYWCGCYALLSRIKSDEYLSEEIIDFWIFKALKSQTSTNHHKID